MERCGDCREEFEILNKAIGLFVGMLTGVVIFFAVGKPIYSRGYLTTQTAGDSEPSPIGYVNSLRNGMTQTGWDKTFAPLDRTPAKFNAVSDLLGILYTNPALTNRLVEYPPFLALFERPEIAEIFTDADYLKLLQEQAGFSALINHGRTQALMSNGDVLETLGKVDLADLRTYLETGKSPKFDDERLLGEGGKGQAGSEQAGDEMTQFHDMSPFDGIGSRRRESPSGRRYLS